MELDSYIDKIIDTQKKIEAEGIQSLDATATVLAAMLMHSAEKLADELGKICKEAAKEIVSKKETVSKSCQSHKNYVIREIDGRFRCELQIQDGVERWWEDTEEQAIDAMVNVAKHYNHVPITAGDIFIGKKGTCNGGSAGHKNCSFN